MIKKFLLDILISPYTQDSLEYNEKNNSLHNKTNSEQYTIVDDVPLLLVPLIEEKQNSSAIHSKYNTEFNYAEHYKIDAEVTDYFQCDTSITARNDSERSHQAIINKVPLTANSILDVGCGGAWVAKYFLARGKTVVSMDISIKNPVEALKQNPGPNHAALIADVFNLPFKKNSFDVIIASEVMEHLYDPKLFINKLLVPLKSGGKLILITPYNEKLVYHLCVHCNKPTPANAHLHSFNKNNITGFLPESGINYTTMHFNNKYFVRLRIYKLLHFLPFRVWLFLDKVLNKLFPKPSLFLIEVVKI